MSGELVGCDSCDLCMTGGLAQLGEHLLCKQGVVGSIPSSSTITSDIRSLAKAVPMGSFRQRFARIGCRSLTIRRVENQSRPAESWLAHWGCRTVPPATT